MPKETMSPRDRWEAVLVRKSPDRVPMDYWATPEATEKLQKHLGMDSIDDIFERLHIDRPVGIGGRYIGPEAPEGEDIFGRRGTVIDYGTGTYNENAHNPLARFTSVEEIEDSYRWPNPDWWEYSNVAADIKGKEHLPISGGGSEPFLAYCTLRGMEQAFIDLVENPEIAHYCLDKLFNLAYENTRRIFEAAPGKILMSYVAEDMGSQESLMFSPKQIHEFLIPRMKRMMDLVHDGGAHVFHHSDGAVRPIINDMIETGIDVLNPVQWRCTGMEREGLKRDFGDRLIFHGGVDNQETMVFGSPDDVREEVAENLRTLGAGGGYIIAPCHNIQAVSDPANVVALYEAGFELGWT
jgi:uroporphyrinogen decarboxylase